MTKCGADEYLENFNVLSILVAALAHDLGHDTHSGNTIGCHSEQHGC